MDEIFYERFTGDTLDLEVWVPYYLAHWSSRGAAAATWELTREGLRLSIPDSQPLWSPDTHDEPLRVSCIQSASFSGPVGSPIGPQPFRDGLIVREEQPTLRGYTPQYGHIEVRMRAAIPAHSMVAFWLAGIEDRPERSGEICVAEIFGSAVNGGSADVGVGIHKFRDPRLTEEFTTIRCESDITQFHTYAVQWKPDGVRFILDDVELYRVDQSPSYPMQLMIGVFDFPARRDPSGRTAGPTHPPELVVAHVRGPR